MRNPYIFRTGTILIKTDRFYICTEIDSPLTALIAGAAADVDITEQDRVVINTLTYEILLVEGYEDGTTSHHKQVWLRISR